jgi:Chaperone of endosialidase
MQFETNTSEWMRLTSGGNLLIGTTTDAGYKLDVNGTIRNTTSSYFATSSGSVGIGITSPPTTLSVKGSPSVPTAATYNGIFGLETAGQTSFQMGIGSVNNGTWFQTYNQPATGGGSFPIYLNPLGGNVSIGIGSDLSYKLGIYSSNLNTIGTCLMQNGTNNGGGYFIEFKSYAGSTAGYISQLTATTILYSTSSDYRLKENILPIQNAIDRILKIKPVTYKWKNTENEYGEGFIAHELQEFVPLAVAGNKDDVNKDGTIKTQGIDYGKLTPLLVKAIQELNEKLVRNNIN